MNTDINYFLAALVGVAASVVGRICWHGIFFINWNYWQKRIWIKRHYRKAFDIKLDDDIARDMAYKACNGPEIDEK